MAENKPSFLSSLLSGISGSLKGSVVGFTVGAALGAAVGATIAIATGGFGLAAIAGGALLGSQLVGIPMGVIGALSGSVTGVVASREAASPSADDIMGVAKMAYAQGVSVGRQLQQEQAQETNQPESTKWRDRHAQEQAAKAISSDGQTIH